MEEIYAKTDRENERDFVREAFEREISQVFIK